MVDNNATGRTPTTLAAGRPARTIIPSARLTDGNNQEAPVTSSHRRAIAAAQTAHMLSTAKNTALDASHTTSTSTPTTSIPPTLEVPSASPTPTSHSIGHVPAANIPAASTASNAIANGAVHTKSTSKRATVEDADDDDEIVPLQPKHVKTGPGRAIASDELDSNGMHRDVHVTEIFDDNDDNGSPKALNKSKPTADIDHFFEKIARIANEKGRRQCTTCQKGLKCAKQEAILVDDCTTLRRHMQSKHKAIYQAWCKAHRFESMLPDDTKARCASALEALSQTQVDGHFKIATPDDVKKPAPYSDELLREAAIKWLIETDQPIQALENESFKEMIAVAARATKGVKLPTRAATQNHIITKFKDQMKGLSERLNSDKVIGEVSLTCDAWTASNGDSYFAVTGHWIEEESPQKWTLQHALLGFTQMNTAHNGARLGQALFKICSRLRILHKIGHITCDNASNNDTMLAEFVRCCKVNNGQIYDVKKRQIRCLAHIVNLATQAVISARSKAKYFNPHDDVEDVPDTNPKDDNRDEVGLIRIICVKARSSSQRKELFSAVQVQIQPAEKALQLLIDMKVRWSSTYIMLYRTETRQEAVNQFIYELGLREKNLDKRRKLDDLTLSDEEWRQVGLFCNLLGYADKAQQAFSADTGPTLFNALPAIESMYGSWEKAMNKPKYSRFVPALREGMAKLDDYYQKTAASDAHIMAMLLHPGRKLAYFKKNWDSDLVDEVNKLGQAKLAERYQRLADTTNNNPAVLSSQARKNNRQPGLARRVVDTDSEDEDEVDPLADPSKPWLAEYNRYITTVESVPDEMGIVAWWGVRVTLNAHCYPISASLARDYLAVMASSVSSERAFSSAGITISKCRNRLKGDIVEALQCLKCMYQNKLIFRDVVLASQVEKEMEKMEYFEHEKATVAVCKEAQEFSWDELVIDDDENREDIVVIN